MQMSVEFKKMLFVNMAELAKMKTVKLKNFMAIKQVLNTAKLD
jgi:hypothetical protein